MLSYRDAVDGLYSWAVSDFTRRQGVDVRSTSALSKREDEDGHFINTPATTRRGPRGHIDSTPAPIVGDDSITDEFPVLQERLQALGAHFKTRVCLLLGDLAYQPDVDMRFLGVVMNFNDVYQPVRKKSTRQPTGRETSRNSARG